MEDLESAAIRLYAAAFDLPEDVVAFALAGADNQTGGELGALTRAKFRALQGPETDEVSTGVMAIAGESNPELENPKAALEEAQRQAREMSARERGFEIMPEMQITAGSGDDDPVSSAPAVVEAEAKSAVDTGIISGGRVIKDKNGWSYKYFEDTGNVQILTAPESNKTAIGMVLTPNESNPERQKNYDAIANFSKEFLSSPSGMVSEEDLSALSPESPLTSADEGQKVDEMTQVTTETPELEEEATEMASMSPADVRKSARRMRRRNRREEAKNIADRLIKKNVGGLADMDMG